MLLIFPPVSMQFWIETPSRLGRLATSLRWHRHPTAALRTFAQVQRCSSVGKSSKETFSPPRSVRWHSFNSSHVTPNQTFNQVKNGMLVRIIESGKTVVKSRCLHPSASQNVIFVFSIVCLPSVDVKIYAYIWLYICAYIRSISMKFLLFVSCKDIKKKYVEIELLSDPSVRGVSTMLVHRTQRHATSNATTIGLSPPYYALFQVLFVTNIFESKTAIVNERTYPARCS